MRSQELRFQNRRNAQSGTMALTGRSFCASRRGPPMIFQTLKVRIAVFVGVPRGDLCLAPRLSLTRDTSPQLSRRNYNSGDLSALQSLVAFAVVTATFLDPGKAAIASGRLVGPVLIKARMHTRLPSGLLGVRRRHRRRKYRVARSGRRSGCICWRCRRLTG